MLDDLISAYGDRFLVAALGVSLALLCLFIVLWILRNRAPSPFVRGGRNRQPRLQVLDAAAVDTRRRIVLIRRDNVEHLVMIGGPTDIVIESGIGDERPYLSARPILPQALEEQPDAPKPTSQAALSGTIEAAAPVIAASAAPLAPSVETQIKRPPVAAEVVRPEPVQQAPRPQPAVAPVVEQRRPQPAPIQAPEAVAERPHTPAVAPVVAPVAAAASVAAPVAMAATAVAADMPRPVPADAPTILAVARPAAVERPPAAEVPDIQPTATPAPVVPAPVLTAEVIAATPTAAPEAIQTQIETALTAPAIEPDITLATPPSETARVEAVEPVIDQPIAEDLLEAARQRVLVPAQAPVQARPFEPQRFEPAVEQQPPMRPVEQPASDMSDFERVLEEEMALHLAADPVPKAAPQSPQVLPETRADRPRPPISAILPDSNRTPGATANAPQQPGQEPNLQTEIARIFGEMSASRNP
ncbi:MAG: flagellar biosynthetic protein FliO [Rhizobium sp.]|nr:flagellar biosynthetic protein FliO [Rhizobium sp.]